MAGICHGSWGSTKNPTVSTLYSFLGIQFFLRIQYDYVIESSIVTHDEPNERGKTGVYWLFGALDGAK
jgi:hypothetical protein